MKIFKCCIADDGMGCLDICEEKEEDSTIITLYLKTRQEWINLREEIDNALTFTDRKNK